MFCSGENGLTCGRSWDIEPVIWEIYVFIYKTCVDYLTEKHVQIYQPITNHIVVLMQNHVKEFKTMVIHIYLFVVPGWLMITLDVLIL